MRTRRRTVQKKPRTSLPQPAKRRNGPRPIYPSDLELERPTYTVLRNARTRAKRDGAVFTISEADIHIPDVCPAIGISLYKSPTLGGGPHSPSLELIDPSKGYTPGNVLVVSALVKRIMSDATLEEMKAIADFYEAAEQAANQPQSR